MNKELDELYVKAMDLFDAGEEEEALCLFRQGAELGDDNAMNMVGLAYDIGNVVELNKEMALQWYKKSWRKGKQLYVCNNIAQTYSKLGQSRRALYWWNKAIARGDISAGLRLAKFQLQARKGRPSQRIIELVQAAANDKAPMRISIDEKEEAEELLKRLQTSSWAKSSE